jgi:hypothetical protein
MNAAELLSAIERHLTSTGINPTRFGRDVAKDPRLVFDLRRGRTPGPKLRARIAARLNESTDA